MKYSQINPTKVGGILLLIGIVLLVRFSKEPKNIGTFIAEDGKFEIPELKHGESATILIPLPERKLLQEYCINLTQDWSWCSYAESQEHFEWILLMYEFSEVTFEKVDEPAIGSSTEPFSVTEVESVKPQEVSVNSSQA